MSEEKLYDWYFNEPFKEFLIKRSGDLGDGDIDLRQVKICDNVASKSWWKVDHQGTTNSCLAFAVGHGPFWYQAVKSRLLKPEEKPSARYIWAAARESDERYNIPNSFIEQSNLRGPESAMGILRKYGCLTDKEFPFSLKMIEESFVAKSTEPIVQKVAGSRRISAYLNLRLSNSEIKKSFKNWRWWLNNVGPIAVSMNVPVKYRRDSPDCWINEDASEPTFSHGMAVVGVEQNHFIFRNSMGECWGDYGHVKIPLDLINKLVQSAYGLLIN